MKLFIGNGTKQNHDFVYWVPDAKSARTQRVPIGGQVAISGDLDQKAIDSIIKQHAPYGLCQSVEVDRVREFTGLCYSVDKPISADIIHKLMMHNTEVLVKRGSQIRREAAIAGNEQLETSLAESGRSETLKLVESSVVEENHDDRSPDPAVAEGWRVSRDAQGDDPPSGRAARRAGRRAA